MNYSDMILSASGWRKVFAASGNQEDTAAELSAHDTALSALMAETFFYYLVQKTGKNVPMIVIGTDTRPTGRSIADAMIRTLISLGDTPAYTGISAAPEIMAYAKNRYDGFIYISASHNPIGHNGVKFGFSDGGVIPAEEASLLIADFKKRCDHTESVTSIINRCCNVSDDKYNDVIAQSAAYKQQAVTAYYEFSKEVISGSKEASTQNIFFNSIATGIEMNPVSIVCDMNGSARTVSIDKLFLTECGIGFHAINNEPGKIVHAIIPEPENLIYCAQEMAVQQNGGTTSAVLGYMPDCDGDRGNIVYWDEKSRIAKVLKAQEVFALSVLSELADLTHSGKRNPVAIAVNDPTSMRIDEIAHAFGAKVARAEVGEANVVNCARELRAKGFIVRILGEGSNGGNITHPAAVRDPLNTLFALIKLLCIRDTTTQKGLFHLWCDISEQTEKYHADFTLTDIISTLPQYTTTGVSEKRAVLQITTTDHAVLKQAYQKEFLASWNSDRSLFESLGITGWKAVCNNGTKETDNITDFGISGKGGLKVILYSDEVKTEPIAFLWMRGSGTEPVFRVMCDYKGSGKSAEQAEASLLAYHTDLIRKADKVGN